MKPLPFIHLPGMQVHTFVLGDATWDETEKIGEIIRQINRNRDKVSLSPANPADILVVDAETADRMDPEIAEAIENRTGLKIRAATGMVTETNGYAIAITPISLRRRNV